MQGHPGFQSDQTGLPVAFIVHDSPVVRGVTPADTAAERSMATTCGQEIGYLVEYQVPGTRHCSSQQQAKGSEYDYVPGK